MTIREGWRHLIIIAIRAHQSVDLDNEIPLCELDTIIILLHKKNAAWNHRYCFAAERCLFT